MPEVVQCCRRCDAVSRFFSCLRTPNHGIDFTYECGDFAQLLVEASAYGCAKPKPERKLVPKKVQVLQRQVIETVKCDRAENAAEIPPVNVAAVTAIEGPSTKNYSTFIVESSYQEEPPKQDESPALQLEESDMEVESEIPPSDEKRMVDAATSYRWPATPHVPPTKQVATSTKRGQRKVTDACMQTSNYSMKIVPPSPAQDDVVILSGNLSTLDVPFDNRTYRKSAGTVVAQLKSPGLRLTNNVAKTAEMIANSPLLRRVSIARPSMVPGNQGLPPASPVILQPATISEASSPSILSMVRPDAPGHREVARKSKAIRRVSELRADDQGFTIPTSKNLPCIVLPSPAVTQRRSQRVRIFGNFGIVRHPDYDVVGVLCCSRSELARIQQGAEPLMPGSRKDNATGGQEVDKQLSSELADGSGRIALAPSTSPGRYFGLFFLSSAGRATRRVNSGYFKFTVLQLKGEHIDLELRGAHFTFKVGGQFAVQPGDDYAMSVYPNGRKNEAILAFDYVLAANKQ